MCEGSTGKAGTALNCPVRDPGCSRGPGQSRPWELRASEGRRRKIVGRSYLGHRAGPDRLCGLCEMREKCVEV